ncbi:DUF928 domain-containing protein [Egbenema bharatensis]|uniref:DUF928 domain-containing protein n=1 Tax=Egbenema bharatensis TaxID=3463334 RepID=UPI003A86082E
MKRLSHPPSPFLTRSIAAFALIAALAFPGIALAQRRYVPRRAGTPPNARTIAGTRTGSCTGTAETAFTLLAPYSHVGQTSNPRPTLSWYVPDAEPVAVELRVYAYATNGHLQVPQIYETTLQSTSGIMSYSLPIDLAVEQTYYWQVALLCNPDHQASDVIAGTEIRIVDPTVDEADRWYDLLNSTLPQLDVLADLADIEQAAGQEWAAQAAAAMGSEQAELETRRIEVLQQSEQLREIVANSNEPISQEHQSR